MSTKFIRYFFMFYSLSYSAQTNSRDITHDNMLWFGYYNIIGIKPKWSTLSDVQFRTKNWYQHFSQALVRTGLNYKLTEKVNVTAGLAHFRFFINDKTTRGEWRPWQEIELRQQFSKLRLSQRLRIEQRFNQQVENSEPINNYQFNHRFRYRIDIRFPLTKTVEGSKALFVLIGNEVIINAGKSITYNYFDQNRLYTGLNYAATKNITIQLQYMHLWQQLTKKNSFLSANVIRFNIYHTIQL
jgi:hypothetical protein